MGTLGHAAAYFIIWWITLFAVLPFGVRTQSDAGERPMGTDPGAPVKPNLGKKFLINTLVAAAVWMVYFMAYQYDWFPVRG